MWRREPSPQLQASSSLGPLPPLPETAPPHGAMYDDPYAAQHVAAQQQQQQGQGQPGQALDVYGMPIESKRDKRRRDMVERVARLHEDTIARRDRVFHELSDIFARTTEELLPPPVFPNAGDPSAPVETLPPSLACTDPVIPDMHPTQFLFGLHRLSMERSNQLVATRLFHAHQKTVARKLYEAEVERIEEEYESAAKGVVERLLEGVEERRRRLTEEKDGEGVTLGTHTFLDPQARSHGTRRMRGIPSSSSRRALFSSLDSSDVSGAGASGDGANGAGPSSAVANGLGGISSTHMHSLLSFNGVQDPFHLAQAFLPHPNHPTSHPLLSSLAASSTMLVGGSMGLLPGSASNAASTLSGGGGHSMKRKSGVPRAQPGLPPTNFTVAVGVYAFQNKCQPGLSSLRVDEIELDLGEVRRKKARTGTGGANGTGGGGRGRRREEVC
ncbi:BQ5605_C002g01750 [Microbotryum silenes-dioicae]|uniref:BQ5605_C002g01750 protein n=1 Tax=Microbotryum silenes-dioicae TaxID=796604 RepID=A0A2X0M405_9BASI|nr:BQ5605_C002g01750 [Microbotryum silenes-dioicae]